MYHLYMISRAFIPPWSLAMRDRKLSDQTLPVKAVGTLVSPSIRAYTLAAEKSRTFPTGRLKLLCSKDSGRSSVYRQQAWRSQGGPYSGSRWLTWHCSFVWFIWFVWLIWFNQREKPCAQN